MLANETDKLKELPVTIPTLFLYQSFPNLPTEDFRFKTTKSKIHLINSGDQSGRSSVIATRSASVTSSVERLSQRDEKSQAKLLIP